MLKTPDKRQKSGADFAAELTRVHQRLREQNARIDQQEQFDVLRRLRFFHEFSHAEIWEVLRASTMTDYPAGEEIVKEGEMDDRFYILVNGKCTVERHGKTLGSMDSGDCFGETSYVRGARRTATIRAESPVSVLRVSSTLLEQVSAACQLRFNRVFLRALVSRLQGNEPPPSSELTAVALPGALRPQKLNCVRSANTSRSWPISTPSRRRVGRGPEGRGVARDPRDSADPRR